MYSRSIAILNDSDILDKVILGKIFRDMKCAEFYKLSRALLEKNRKVDFEIIISMIKIRIFSSRIESFSTLVHPSGEYCGAVLLVARYEVVRESLGVGLAARELSYDRYRWRDSSSVQNLKFPKSKNRPEIEMMNCIDLLAVFGVVLDQS